MSGVSVRDGVVVIRKMIDDEWIARMRAAIDELAADPASFGLLGFIPRRFGVHGLHLGVEHVVFVFDLNRC
jgi:hypothetical protein